MPQTALVFDPRDPDVIQRPLETLLRLQAEGFQIPYLYGIIGIFLIVVL